MLQRRSASCRSFCGGSRSQRAAGSRPFPPASISPSARTNPSPSRSPPEPAKRSVLLHRELAQSASQDHLNRPWKNRSRSAIERRLAKTRRGRAPAGSQVTMDARHHSKARRRKRSGTPHRFPSDLKHNPVARLAFSQPRNAWRTASHPPRSRRDSSWAWAELRQERRRRAGLRRRPSSERHRRRPSSERRRRQPWRRLSELLRSRECRWKAA